jgi:hypothetical protein
MNAKLIDQTCRINRCDEAARYNLVMSGHPNGDYAASYCAEHVKQKAGHWDESPTPYSITVTGPYGGKA